MRIIRVLAQLVDLFVCFAAFVISFLAVPPVLSRLGMGPAVNGAAVFVIWILLAFGAQYPFMKTGQTVGKAFLGLTVVSDLPERPISMSVMLQREIFLKLASCYFICIPVLLGRCGGHEAATQTKVIRRGRNG